MEKNRILVIDDEAEILDIVRARIEELGLIVDTAISGKEGMRLFTTNRPKYMGVICDIEMPDVLGNQVLKEIRAVDEEVPFIFFTGHGSRERMMEAVQFGVRDFVSKPNIECLAGVVEELKGLRPTPDTSTPEENLSEYKKLLSELEEKGK